MTRAPGPDAPKSLGRLGARRHRTLIAAASVFLLGMALPPVFFAAHESAHCCAARMLGWKAQLHWGWVTLNRGEAQLPQRDMPREESRALLSSFVESVPRPDRWKFLLFELSGPIVSLAIGGFAVAVFRARMRGIDRIAPTSTDWVLLSLALFLARQPLVLLEQTGIEYYGLPTSVYGDEETAAMLLGLPPYALHLTLCVIALFLIWHAVAPVSKLGWSWRHVVLFVVGAVIGSIGWISYVGPAILP